MDLIEQIAPVAGGLALIALGVLAFLLFQQGREIRRLREWAGRAPERAIDAAVASLAAAEARNRNPEAAAELDENGEPVEYGDDYLPPDRNRYRRRSPWPAILGILLVLVVIGGAVVLTDGFGLLGADKAETAAENEQAKKKPKLPKRDEVTVAVLNATQGAEGAIPGLAASIAQTVVGPRGYDVIVEADASTSSPSTAVAYTGDNERLARRLAKDIKPQLGEVNVTRMNSQIEADSGGAQLALVIGLDRASFGQ